MKIKLTKIANSHSSLYPDNTKIGFTKTINVSKRNFKKPTVGKRFTVITYSKTGKVINHYSTSPVQYIISTNTFRTFNSIYKLEILTV